jgi:endonuclease/exonuclease/phosphatase family metal-dependent hydrolase
VGGAEEMMRALFFVLLASCGDTPDAGNDASVDAADDVIVEAASDATDAAPEADAQRPTGMIVRIVAANITSGTDQSYEDPGIRIFQGLKPDVVLIQEFNYATGQRALVDAAFGTSFSYFVEPSVNIPNGIVSRFPILSSGTWVDASVTDRGFAWALIDLPGATDLFAVSLHLLTTDAAHRDTEAQQLVAYVQQNQPAGTYLVIGGDLNTDATTEPALADLGALVGVAPPYPMDQLGNSDTSTNRNRPHDWVMPDSTLAAHAVATWVGNSIYGSGLVFDSRVYTPLSEVAPVLVTDSAEAGMQHMPVVRDFSF